jgi:HEPN domain-containing protein
MTSGPADLGRASVQALLDDAWDQYRSAIERLNAGDVRDACGKAWNATRAASEAAVLAHQGNTATTINISTGIRLLSRQYDLPRLSADYAQRAQYLHNDACYYGACENEDIPDLIYGTAEYIRAAEELAQYQEG